MRQGVGVVVTIAKTILIITAGTGVQSGLHHSSAGPDNDLKEMQRSLRMLIMLQIT